ncbi:MAG: TonB-dependent receptor [Deltaproteobacteria bacterium]|nr:TonB-dependent receptor [Deltaproteobacteria bacterium]
MSEYLWEKLTVQAVIVLVLSLFVWAAAAVAADGDGTAGVDLPIVNVLGERDGSTESGYKVEQTKNLSLWGDREILDTPYSMFVISSDLIENVQAGSTEQLFKMNPLTSSVPYDTDGITRVSTRGFQTSRTFVNGVMNDVLGFGVFVEEVETIEVISGLYGFMYGEGNPGGIINYNVKRPTAEFLNKITVGNYGGQQYYVHGDFGGPLLDGKLGYRFNVMKQDGRTNIEKQKLDRSLVSLAVDWKPNEDLILQLATSYGQYHLDGVQPRFLLQNITADKMPDPLDSTKLWGPDNGFNDLEAFNLALGAKYRFSDNFSVRAAYNYREIHREALYGNTQAYIINNNRQYQINILALASKWESNGGYFYLDSKFKTFGVEHALTAGVNGFIQDNYTGVFDTPTGPQVYPGLGTNYVFDINDPYAGHIKAPSYNRYRYSWSKGNHWYHYNLMVGDDIKFNDQWSILAGVNHATIDNRNYNTVTRVLNNRYKKSATTPSVSLIYKPMPNMTAYATYMEALQPGYTVGQTYKNANEILEPLKSKQYEFGVKADVGAVRLTAALFQIDKANYESDDGTNFGTMKQDGRQVHRGLELTAQGKLTDDLTVYGGATFLDAEITKTTNPALKGQTPAYVPKSIASLYAEYNVPVIDGLTLTGGVYHEGEAYVHTNNLLRIPSHTIGDLGFRFKTAYFGPEMTFRFNVNNITDERYWSGIENGSLGSARSIVFSVEASF